MLRLRARYYRNIPIDRADYGTEIVELDPKRTALIGGGGGECPDTFTERVATRWGIRFFENHYGSTIAFSDFIRALRNIRRADARVE